ncbi:Zinc finger protein 219-like [Homarus americanus]|uniref:Zinc finger protein 219-like n=1 Tax=Homarus americanus TaxID=6706 RepID=A0A8J5JZK5_HOMAM|nr:Zinc finger protein 219-like [Homarus americanus]
MGGASEAGGGSLVGGGPRCNFCGKVFRWPCLLQRHIRIHTGERPYSCPHCPYAAAQKFDVTKHILALHLDKIQRPLP